MEVYLKDNNGDQGSPINGRLLGLFFAASRKPYTISPFGDTRFVVPWELILNNETNMYFADFYCNSNPVHFVTLIITKENTERDHFCKMRLPKLDLWNNEFLKMSATYNAAPGFQGTKHKLLVSEMCSLQTEILFTENIDLHEFCNQGAFFCTVPSAVTIKAGSLSKYRLCSICNL